MQVKSTIPIYPKGFVRKFRKMVRKPYIDKKGLKRGAWSEEEDNKLRTYILRYKAWNWNHLPRFAGLARCGKSCRMRWENYLKPGVKRGGISKDEEELILKMQKEHGNKWSLIAKRMPGRTDNEIKNYWHTILSMRIKQNQNSIVFMENDVEPSEEEMHSVDQTKNNVSVHESSIQDKEDDGSFSEIILLEGEPSKPYVSLDESVSMMTTSTMLMDDASHNKNFPTTNDTVSSYEETLLENSSNTEKAPTYTSFTLTEDMILNLEESFFAAPESFTLEPFQLMDKDKYSYSSSSSSDFCPSLMNFPSSSCKSRLDTHDSWSPDESVSTEPSSTDASNTPFLQLETSTLLGRLDSLESFGFWKALWNILK